MHFFGTKDKPPVYAGIAAVSLMILTGLTLAGTAVVLTVMTPVFVLLSPILIPAVITSSFLATGFLASGSLGASAIGFLVWLYYKKEEHFTYTLHARGVPPKENKGGKLPGGDTPPGKEKPAEEEKPSEKEKLSERDNRVEEDKSLGEVKHAEEVPKISAISKVLLEEKNPIGPQHCSPSTSTKRSHQMRFSTDPAARRRSIFMKEYQKVPRVGAFAYKYFTSRDKIT